MSGDYEEDVCRSALSLVQELCFSLRALERHERCLEFTDLLRNRGHPRPSDADISVSLLSVIVTFCGIVLLGVSLFVSWKLCWVPWRDKGVPGAAPRKEPPHGAAAGAFGELLPEAGAASPERAYLDMGARPEAPLRPSLASPELPPDKEAGAAGLPSAPSQQPVPAARRRPAAAQPGGHGRRRRGQGRAGHEHRADPARALPARRGGGARRGALRPAQLRRALRLRLRAARGARAARPRPARQGRQRLLRPLRQDVPAARPQEEVPDQGAPQDPQPGLRRDLQLRRALRRAAGAAPPLQRLRLRPLLAPRPHRAGGAGQPAGGGRARRRDAHLEGHPGGHRGEGRPGRGELLPVLPAHGRAPHRDHHPGVQPARHGPHRLLRPLREGVAHGRGPAAQEAQDVHQEEHAEPQLQRGAGVRRAARERAQREPHHRRARLRLHRAQRGDRDVPRGQRRRGAGPRALGRDAGEPPQAHRALAHARGGEGPGQPRVQESGRDGAGLRVMAPPAWPGGPRHRSHRDPWGCRHRRPPTVSPGTPSKGPGVQAPSSAPAG